MVASPPSMFTQVEKAFRACEQEVSSPSRAPLYWVLRYVYGLEVVEAQDAICDGANDKGIDAIHVDETDRTIYVLQSRRRTKYSRTLGDTELKNFVGTLQQFATPEGVALIEDTGNAELRNLISRHELVARSEADYRLQGMFVTNSVGDAAAKTFLATQSASDVAIELWDLERLYKALRHIIGSDYVPGPAYLHFTRSTSFSHTLNEHVKMIVALVPATDVAALPGIDDNTIFDHNVRGPLGNTRINKDIRRTINDHDEHQLFPAFHNGLTIICKKLKQGRGRLQLRDMSIVNGCQSVKTIAGSRSNLTDDLKVLVKIVNADPESSPLAYELTDKITQRSNNQNAITMRDLRSTDAKQRELAGEFAERFGGQVLYDIRRGDKGKAETLIPNDLAAQEIVSFYLKEPWEAHKKTELFETKYDVVFSKGIHAEHILLSHLAYEAAIVQRANVKDPSVGTYQLTAFVLMYLARCVLEQGAEELDVLDDPLPMISDPQMRARVRDTLETLMGSIVVDVNFYVHEQKKEDEFWDYRRAFKRKAEVTSLGNEVVRTYLKDVARDPSRRVSLGSGMVLA